MNSMFSFLSMFEDYETRKVARWDNEAGDKFVSTASVDDSKQPYETAIRHPQYNDGKVIIVGIYNTKEEALAGHKDWVQLMVSDTLPDIIEDVSTADVALLRDKWGKGWRKRKRQGKKLGKKSGRLAHRPHPKPNHSQ